MKTFAVCILGLTLAASNVTAQECANGTCALKNVVRAPITVVQKTVVEPVRNVVQRVSPCQGGTCRTHTGWFRFFRFR
jgi:hypothetical protein